MASPTCITDELDNLDRASAPVVNEDDPVPNGDEEKARVEKAFRELRNPKMRRWAYLREARRARRYDQTRTRGQRSDRILTATEFQLLFALVERANPDLTNSYPGIPLLARAEGWSESRVRKVLGSLVQKKWIKRWPHPLYAGARGNQFLIPPGALAPWAERWDGPRPFQRAKRGD